MTSTSRNIGIFATEISSRIQGNLYRELHKKAEELGYKLVLFSGTYDKNSHNRTMPVSVELFKLAESMDFCAFIVHVQSLGEPTLTDYIINLGHRKNIPVFAYDCEPSGITKVNGVIPINPDYKQGFRECVKHLIEYHGCRNIFMLGGIKDNRYSEDRIDVYRQEMDAHGLAYCEKMIGYGDFWERPAIDAVNKFLDSGLPTPEAICCANDLMAITAIKVLSQRGLRVPEDVLITGLDGIEDGKYNYPSISTCEPRLEEVSAFIFDVIRGRNKADEFFIPFTFCPKKSSGCTSEEATNGHEEISRLIHISRMETWQHDMITNMQYGLMNSAKLDEMIHYMYGPLGALPSYAHLFCFRNDIEEMDDYTAEFGMMRVFLNKEFMCEKEYPAYEVQEVAPCIMDVFQSGRPEDMYILRLIHNGDKMYGYHIIRSNDFISNDMKLFSYFNDCVTILIESILRNMRLKTATDKLNEMYERMAEIYIRDSLTGLYNRYGYYRDIEDYITRTEFQDKYVHVVLIDMDGMKKINDTYGHQEGDNAIQAVAQAMKSCFTAPCILSRFGGDEFAAVQFTDTAKELSTAEISDRLNSYLAEKITAQGKEYKVGVSVGQAVVKVSEVVDLKEIERLADSNMYADKQKRKKM